MNAVEVRDPRAFLAEVEPFLVREEARHNLLLGIAGTLVRQPRVYESFHLWRVSEDGTVVACALMTPPFNVVVSRPAHEGALAALATAVAEGGSAPPGATGAVPEIEGFASIWHRITGDRIAVKTRQKIYEARSVLEPRGVPGRMREATSSDRTLLLEWIRGFYAETPTERPGADDRLGELVDLRLRGESGRFFLWEDNRPVSLLGYGAFTPNGARIGPVYTPPEHRGRGYASALTAGATRMLLERGRRFCYLYTDASNPTSNRIYQAIGYRPVCDSIEYRFER